MPASRDSAVDDASVRADVPHVLDVLTASGKKLKVQVVRDAYVLPETEPDEVEVVAEVGSNLVIVDTYMSVAGGASYCQAGKERFLRIFAIQGEKSEETLRLKLESCWQHIELLESGVEWLPASSTLRMKWLFGPLTKDKAEELTLRVDSEG